MELLKKLVMNRENVALISHYTAGNLYYNVETVEENNESVSLSSDLGTTSFGAKIKAATMMRYIRKAIKNETLIKVK